MVSTYNFGSPKDTKEEDADQLCALCGKWFSIFSVQLYYLDATPTYVCHGDVREQVQAALRSRAVTHVQEGGT